MQNNEKVRKLQEKTSTFVRVNLINVVIMTRIFLIGYMGAGKTTLGKALAREMNLSFIDLDWHIEGRFHKTVSEVFAERGEDGFRELERQMLHEVAEFEDVIISTGGGTPCFFDNMDFMCEHGSTVFLNASQDTLLRRLKAAKQSRPLLRDKSDEELMDFIRNALEVRLPYYIRAEYVVPADELETREQIAETVRRFRERLGV